MKCMLCRKNDYDVECVACKITVCGSCRLSCKVCHECVCKRCAGLGFQCTKRECFLPEALRRSVASL